MRVLKSEFIRLTMPLLLTALVLSGCAGTVKEEAVQETAALNTQVAAKTEINDVSIVDNPLLYSNDDPYSVVTMYLTVRKGNQGDGTNYTWKEVNTHSTYYYDENNINRYKVEGLIQVGDETGPKPGELGYNVIAPNATVQIRGKTTSLAPQKSYKIEVKRTKANGGSSAQSF